jgi:hypothetical protein
MVADPSCTAAHLFRIVWDTMADILGTPATATLMRRSARRAAVARRDLEGLIVTRAGYDYSYSLPEQWNRNTDEPVAAVRELARVLSPLLIELTGPVIIRRLDAIPDLQRSKIIFSEAAR